MPPSKRHLHSSGPDTTTQGTRDGQRQTSQTVSTNATAVDIRERHTCNPFPNLYLFVSAGLALGRWEPAGVYQSTQGPRASATLMQANILASFELPNDRRKICSQPFTLPPFLKTHIVYKIFWEVFNKNKNA